MARLSRKRVKPAGSSPGTVVYVGTHRDAPVAVSQTVYSTTSIEERGLSVQELRGAIEPYTTHRDDRDKDDRAKIDRSQASGVLWCNVDGVHDTSLLTTIGDIAGLHPLVVEDIANTVQRPKLEDFGSYLFVAMKMIVYERDAHKLKIEHVSLILGENFVITFLEDRGDVFDPVRNRLRAARGQIRGLGADYLLYALIDAVVDQYFEVLEELGEDIERIEHAVIDEGGEELLRDIYAVKRQLITFRRAVWPLREAIHSLQRDDSTLVRDSTRVFLRDLYDHSVHVLDAVETSRDIVSGMLDVYLSSTNNKMNQVMKVLTVMSSIFIPLTFIVGVYGMNFQNMPELTYWWGYPAVMIVMFCIAAGLLIQFRRKGWI